MFCGGNDPNLYTGPWVLFGDVDMSDEEKMIEGTP